MIITHCQFVMHCDQKNYTVIFMFSSTSASVLLYNTLNYFCEAKPCKMFTKMELATNFNFTKELQDFYCLHMLLAPMKEKKVAYQAWIKVFTARDYPNVFSQSILICALSLH